jgi:hypothetical protein
MVDLNPTITIITLGLGCGSSGRQLA